MPFKGILKMPFFRKLFKTLKYLKSEMDGLMDGQMDGHKTV